MCADFSTGWLEAPTHRPACEFDEERASDTDGGGAGIVERSNTFALANSNMSDGPFDWGLLANGDERE